jgi:amidase
VAAATASDGGGSIRIPAACCGLVGMKPSRGRVSAAPGQPGWLGLSTYGALARTVADSALLLDVMHGTAAGEEPALPLFDGSYVEAAGTAPRPLRIAVSTKVPPVALTSPGAAQRAVHEGTARLLEQLGHHVSQRDPDYGTAQLQFTQTWVRGVYEDAAGTGRRSEFERSTRQMAAAGRYLVPPPRRRRLLRVRPLTTERITALWDAFDVLMTPALASAPVAAEGGYGRAAAVAIDIAGRMSPFTAVFNLTGQPAVTVPIGVDGEGLPTAVQLIGRVGAEDVLYALAGQLERAAPWGQRRPVVS